MKNRLPVFITALLLIIAVFSGCNDREYSVENAETGVIEAERDLEIATAEAQAEVRIFRQEMNNQIVENNRNISTIKERILNEEDTTKRSEYEERITDLEKTNQDLKQQLDGYNHTNRENWDDFRDGFSNNIDNLGDSLDDFFTGRTTATN